MTDKLHHDELNLLHEICDGDIALHSVELAIKVLVCCYLTYQSRAQVLRLLRETITISLVKDIRGNMASREVVVIPRYYSNDNSSDSERRSVLYAGKLGK